MRNRKGTKEYKAGRIFLVNDEVVYPKKRRAFTGIWWAGSDRRCDDALSHTRGDVC